MRFKVPVLLLATLIVVSAFAFSCAKETPPAPAPAATLAPATAAPPAAPPAVTPAPAKPAPAAPPPAAGPRAQPANHTGRTACRACHEQAVTPKIPADHGAERTDATCATCHKAP